MTDWRQLASCTGTDPDLWFDPIRVLEAEQMCAGCPVLAECREFAGQVRVSDGVFGGQQQHSRPLSVQAYLREGHGTIARERRHRRDGEQPCPSCAEAERLRQLVL